MLPSFVHDNGALVVDDLRGAAPLAFRTENGATFTWLPDLSIVEGDTGDGTLVELPEDVFSDFLHELVTANGAIRTGRATIPRGDVTGWQRWEPAIQSLLSARPIYGPHVNAELAGFDLHRSFAPDAPRAELRAYLDRCGYLHVRGVFGPDEVARYGEEVERARAGTVPGDSRSWWSVNSRGQEVVTRINHVERFAPALLDLAHDERLTSFARLAGDDLRVCDDRLDGPMVFVKHSDVVKGNGDLVWHVDDGIGGHPVMCPLVQAGIQLDHADAENGQLLVLAGSHRYTKHWLAWGDEGDLPVVALDTEPGDLTIHFGDTMHSTPAPTGSNAGRRVLYYKFAEPKTFRWVPPGCHYNDALFLADESGRVATRAATY